MTHLKGQQELITVNDETIITTFSYDLRTNIIQRPKMTHPPEAYDPKIGRTLKQRTVYEDCSSGQLVLALGDSLKGHGGVEGLKRQLSQTDSLTFNDFKINNMQVDQVEYQYRVYNMVHYFYIQYTSDLIIKEPPASTTIQESPVQEFLNG